MLQHLFIKNFIFIDTLELTFDIGVIMITGETGAGKSLILGAIDAALGQRGAQEKIKLGANEAEIILTFDISHNKKAAAFLEENALADEKTCIIRRIIYQDGKTRNFINGRPINISTLRECGELLLTLHTQHENQLLLSTSGQTQLLDAYADNQALLNHIEKSVAQWKKLDTEIKALTEQTGAKNQRLDYLRYQHKELQDAQLNLEEILSLPEQHKLLTSAQEALQSYEAILNAFAPNDSAGIIDILQRLRQPIITAEKLSHTHEISDLLNSAIIQLEELQDSVHRMANKIELNPEKCQKIEARISELHQLARKHHLSSEELPALLQKIEQEIEMLSASDKKISHLQQEKQHIEEEYQQYAIELSKKRSQAAKKLAKKVTELIHQLGMPAAAFDIALHPRDPMTLSRDGAEHIEFLLKANATYPASPLKKAASGGELARVSLALQTTLAAYIQIPTLILDEIDVGVGGKVAAMIGQQLRELGKTHQVLCITHQAQIAACGHQHLKVEKTDKKQHTIVTVSALNRSQRIDEIARMLGGLTITEHARQHAKEMLGAFIIS